VKALHRTGFKPKLRGVPLLIASALLAISGTAIHAEEYFEARALELADLPSEPVKTPESLHAYAEFATGQRSLLAGADQTVHRLSMYVVGPDLFIFRQRPVVVPAA
jgi:hypothetical protein